MGTNGSGPMIYSRASVSRICLWNKWRRAEDWYLFDPHEVKRIMGYSLEDYFDEEKGAVRFARSTGSV